MGKRGRKRYKKSKTYYTGIMVLLFVCAMYLVLYPQFQSLHQQEEDQQQETLVSEFSSSDAAAQAISLIEEKEEAAKEDAAAADQNVKEETSSEEGNISTENEASSGEDANASTDDDETTVTDTQDDATASASTDEQDTSNQVYYQFRSNQKYKDHFNKHGAEMGFSTPEEYLDAANALINNPDALHKLEKEDNDEIYYLESTNEIAFVSQDGYLRTYFICSGRNYYDRQ